jgi:hypothetical protein
MISFAFSLPLPRPQSLPRRLRAVPQMVEGHAVQRLAAAHRATLLRRAFRADSPNGRFAEGASAIDGRTLERVEAVGKNLFHFYGDATGDTTVVHIRKCEVLAADICLLGLLLCSD